MYVKNVVICDSQKQYSENLFRALVKNKTPEEQYYLFHDMQEVEQFAKDKKIYALLTSEECPKEQRGQVPVARRFVLVRERTDSLDKGEIGIYRYQSASDIRTQLLERRIRQKEPRRSTKVRKGGQLIAVYSPIHRIGKTRFALALGKKLAEREPVLYLNLEGYAGSSCYFTDSVEQTLSDLIYYLRQEKGNLGMRISMMAGQLEKLDYIRPMPYILDMQEIKGEEWLQLFRQILNQCIYEKIILDLGDSVNGLFEILEACHTIYTPYIEEKAAMAKLAEYTENLRKTGKEQVLEKTIQKRMR